MHDQVNDHTSFVDLRGVVIHRLPSGAASESAGRVRTFEESKCFVRPGFPDIPFSDGEMWSDESDRAQSRFMHGLIFFADWPLSIKNDSTGALAAAAINIIRCWHSRYPSRQSLNPMAYHDETTAQRMINLLAIHNACIGLLMDHDLKWLEEILDETASILEDSEFHSTGNNHGMFQDIALINYSVIANWRNDSARVNSFEIGERRIRQYFLSCFTSEGVHRENTPTYHLMICHQLKSHLELIQVINHPDLEILTDIFEKASIFATHSIMPSGKFPPVSDTTQKSLEWQVSNLFEDNHFKYAASRGLKGEIPQERVLLLGDSGYMIYRSSWSDPNATFAYFHAAYNADYHKHSDDLSFLLTSNGIDLITEAGPHGYNYKDPVTVFAYGQYAHNNIVVNRKSVRRTDNKSDTVRMYVEDDSVDNLSVRGVTERLYETKHSRTVKIIEEAGETKIDVLDSVESESENDFDLVWNLGPDVVPVVHGQGFELFHRGVKIMDALTTADVPLKISLQRGATHPIRVGWRCPAFGVSEPNNAIMVSFRGRRASVETRFRLKSFNYVDRGLTATELGWDRFQGQTSLNYKLRKAPNSSGAQILVVVFSAIGSVGDFTYNYAASLESSSANILYILDDFGDQGSYNYMDHGDKYIFDTTQALIGEKLQELGLKAQDLVTAGSSKGGAAALIHGITAKAGHIYVGAPQTRIGSFLAKPHPNVLEFMTGGNTEEDILNLDSVIVELARTSTFWPKVTILVGDADHHYRSHVLPFLEEMASISRDVGLVLKPGLPHNEIGPVYGRALQDYVSAVLSTSQDDNGSTVAEEMPSANLTLSMSGSAICLDLVNVGEYEISPKLYLENDVVDSIGYSRRISYRWDEMADGRYRVRVYLRKVGDLTSRHAFTTPWVRVAGRICGPISG